MTQQDRMFVLCVMSGLSIAIVVAIFFGVSGDAIASTSPIARLVIVSSLVLGTAGALAPLMQLHRILATHSARDVSLAFLSLYGLTCITGLALGLVLRQPAIYVVNGVAMVTVFSTLFTAARLRWIYRNFDRTAAIAERDAAAGALISHLTTEDPLGTLHLDATA